MALEVGTPPKKSKKEIWKEKVNGLKDTQLTVKALSDIIGVSKSVVYRDLENKSFKGATKKGTGIKSDWTFTHEDACNYIDSFEDNIFTPPAGPIKNNKIPAVDPIILPSKKIPFPDWSWSE